MADAQLFLWSMRLAKSLVLGSTIQILPEVGGPNPSGDRAGSTGRTVPGVCLGLHILGAISQAALNASQNSATRCKRSLVCSAEPIGDAALDFWSESSA